MFIIILISWDIRSNIEYIKLPGDKLSILNNLSNIYATKGIKYLDQTVTNRISTGREINLLLSVVGRAVSGFSIFWYCRDCLQWAYLFTHEKK